MTSSINSNPALEKLRKLHRLSKYGMILDGRLDKEKTFVTRTGTAVVCKGTLRMLGDGEERMEVAIKTLLEGLRNEEKAIKDFLREAHTWSKLEHENVLALEGITTEIDYTVSLVSKWMEKGNAHDYVNRKEVDPRLLIRGIAHGLEYLHSRKPGMVVHGDVKGRNVLISNEGNALLTDFGLSCLANSSFSMTKSNPIGGSVRWSAPEILDGAMPSAATDVWSFGMTALELFTRKHPFPHLNMQAAVMSCIARGPLPLRPGDVDTQSRMTDDWWNMICRCWIYKPTERPNISTIVENIEHIFPSKKRPSITHQTVQC